MGALEGMLEAGADELLSRFCLREAALDADIASFDPKLEESYTAEAQIWLDRASALSKAPDNSNPS